MAANKLEGKITYINHEKNYVMVEYEAGGKKRVVKGKATSAKSNHQFVPDDIISFKLGHIAGTDKQSAEDIKFLYNTALDVVLQKAKIANQFTGYLKQVNEDYFVKEINSYLFFKINLSRWQLPPKETIVNEQVEFFLDNLDKKEKVSALLFDNDFIPEYSKALKAFRGKEIIETTVTKISPHGIYVNVFDDKITGKLDPENEKLSAVKVGDTVPVMISYMSKDKIVLEAAL